MEELRAKVRQAMERSAATDADTTPNTRHNEARRRD
jgi:hypothetical protein